jgi:hypothetical protein
MLDRIADSQITAPRVAQHDPAAHTDSRTNAFEIGDRPFHRVRAAARAADAARFRIPGAVVGRCDLLPLQVLHATRSAGQDDQVGPQARHTNVQRDAVYRNDPRLHVRGG